MAPTPLEERSSGLEKTAPAASKPRRPRVRRPDLEPLERLCVGILAFIESQSGRVTASQLQRGTNASRRPEIYKAAIQHLLELRAITVEKERGSKRRWITLLKIPKHLRATKLKPKRRHRPRRRGRTPRFELLLAKRDLTKEIESLTNDILAKPLAVLTNDLREARREDRRRGEHRFIAAVLTK